MKVVIATPLYPPEIGGPATYTKELEEELPKQGVQVVVVKFSDVRRLPPVVRHVKYAWMIFKQARSADAVFAQDVISVGWPAFVATLSARKKFLVRVPGDQVWEQGKQRFGIRESLDDFPRFSWRWHPYLLFLRLLQHIVVRFADAVIAPSEYFGRVVASWGAPKEGLHVIYNGIHLPLASIPPQETPPAPFIVSVGRLVPWKGFGGLIRLMQRMPEWHLVIVGEGPLRAMLAQEARKAGVETRVTFTGSLAHEEVIGWYKAATAFVLNSSFESFSFQVVEAMAAGVPVIATNIGSIPELITDGIEGVLVQPDNLSAIQRTLENMRSESERWRIRVEIARMKAAQFTIQRTARELVAILKNLV